MIEGLRKAGWQGWAARGNQPAAPCLGRESSSSQGNIKLGSKILASAPAYSWLVGSEIS
jgi:hypothetical protein